MRIGSRGSKLALWQANHIADLLRAQGHEVEIEIIKTTGRRDAACAVRARSARRACSRRRSRRRWRTARIDLAVHSLKDLPTELDRSLCHCGDSRTGRSAGCLCLRRYASFEALPQGRGSGRAVCGGRRSFVHGGRGWSTWSFAGMWTRGCASWPRDRWTRQCWRRRGWSGWADGVGAGAVPAGCAVPGGGAGRAGDRVPRGG